MSWADGLTYDSAAAIRQQLEDKARKKAEQERQDAERRRWLDGAIETALRHAEGGNVPAMRKWVELFAEKKGIRVRWVQSDPRGGLAVGRVATGDAYVELVEIRSLEDFVKAVHELAHCLSEPCQGAGHQRRPGRGCIRCERLAWETAMRLVPFSKRMHADLKYCLGTYRTTTPAPERELQEADRLRGNLTWAMDVQRRRRAQWEAEGRQRLELLQERLNKARRNP